MSAIHMPKGVGYRVERKDLGRTMEGADIASSKSAPCTVTVMGFDSKDVLFRTDKANVIQVRNGAGVISALLVRLKGDIWGFTKRGDEDWEENLALYGNKDGE